MVGLENLVTLYIPLVGWVGLGLILGYSLPKSVPVFLGKFLFWIGVPLSIMTFLRQADLSASVWIAPVVCWIAILLGATLAWLWIRSQIYLERITLARAPHPPAASWQRRLTRFTLPSLQARPTQGSFLLASMVGNTGYLGYPITLALVGPQYFGWAVFYDTLGSTLGAYGLGVVLAAHFGAQTQGQWQLLQALIKNPALWSFWLGLWLRQLPFPAPVEQGLKSCAWTIVTLALVLLGMRLSQLTSWQNIQHAGISLAIKMLIIPLSLGLGLSALGVTGFPLLVIVLEMSMPPAFATLVIAEAYDLDRELTVTTLALGSILLLLLLPVWLWLFAS
jgi:predicted permease